jgi:hypothetical protein
MAHAQKTDFVFRRIGRVHLNRRGPSVESTTGSRGVGISCSNAGYTMFRGSVNGTRYPLHSPVSPSLPLPCVTVCHHISTGLYLPFYMACLSRDYASSLAGRRVCWILRRTELNINLKSTFFVNII